MKTLSTIVEGLEGGELSLEESLSEFERGVHLIKNAQKTLDAAEAKVEELLSVDDDGQVETAPLEEDDE